MHSLHFKNISHKNFAKLLYTMLLLAAFVQRFYFSGLLQIKPRPHRSSKEECLEIASARFFLKLRCPITQSTVSKH